MKTIITITGIRPDFIRMSEIFKKLDENFNHILIHTGQHYDKLLSDIFFDELNIRKPNYNLSIGGDGKEHFHQLADLSVKLIELIRSENLNPDLVLFLGDSNSVTSAISLKKEGYRIGHIEAGMRSGDKRMLEEINRIVCDQCSDLLFVYHKNYKTKLLKENVNPNSIFVVGNTIVETAININKTIIDDGIMDSQIILDIHRPENFKYKARMENIIRYANALALAYNLPIKMLDFKRTTDKIKEFDISTDGIEIIPLMSYKEYITNLKKCKFLFSDSGSAQEEAAIFNIPVIVPRDYTERPESVDNACSYMLNVNELLDSISKLTSWIEISKEHMLIDWLGDGTTSFKIMEILKEQLQ